MHQLLLRLVRTDGNALHGNLRFAVELVLACVEASSPSCAVQEHARQFQALCRRSKNSRTSILSPTMLPSERKAK